MRAIIQRVTKASVTVDGEVVSAIGPGICVLLGICRQDAAKDVEFISRKILNLRLFDDDDAGKRWAAGVKDKNLEILCVSQFTLHAVLKGNKPDFHQSMAGDLSKSLFDSTVASLAAGYRNDKVKTGVFGAMMQVEIVNDGPVTITIDSGNNNEGGNPASPDDAGSKSGKNKVCQKRATEEIVALTPMAKPVVGEGRKDESEPTEIRGEEKSETGGNEKCENRGEKKSFIAAEERSDEKEEADAKEASRVDQWKGRLQLCARLLGTFLVTPLESVVATLKTMARSDAVNNINHNNNHDALLGRSPEDQALVNHWLHHGVDIFQSPSTNDEARLKELDAYLTSRVFIAGHELSIADVFFFACLHDRVAAMSFLEKQKLMNLTRWFSCLQDHFQKYLSDVVFTRSLLY